MDSRVWRNILRSRSLISQGIRWKVGDGTNIRFWWDNWVDDTNLVNLLDIDPSTPSSPNLKVCAVITRDHCWDVNTNRSLVRQENIVQKIIGIPLPFSEMADSFRWAPTGSGEFSTKTATWMAHNSFHTKDPKWTYNWIWKLDVMPKIKIFLWQNLHNALPTRGTLFRRGMNIDPACPICGDDIETSDHLF